MTTAPRLEKPQPIVVECAELSLHSVFQPIVSVAHCRVVGQEALLRGTDREGYPLTPSEIFPRLVQHLPSAEVHETCSRLHLGTYAAQEREGWLFLNANPASLGERQNVVDRFGHWLTDAGVPAHSVVIEIVETRSLDERRLAYAVDGYRELGCLVALDDFGAGESNFERIWRLRPDLVKLDRAMIAQASSTPLIRGILPGLVSLLHEAGCLVVMEGIETEEQALIALETGADFVQGYLFSKPSRDHHAGQEIREKFMQLSSELRDAEDARAKSDQAFFARFTAGLEGVMRSLLAGEASREASQPLLGLTGVQRVYQLDADGLQVGPNLESGEARSSDPRFLPCADARGASWFRRPYFQRAVREPNRVQVTRPYLSVRDARPCVTLSIAYQTPHGQRVLCADVDSDLVEPLSRRAPCDSGVRLR